MRRTPDPEKISAAMTWREFETYAEHIFISFGFETRRNVRFKKPTMELDLLASKDGLGFAVDCKHWKRTAGRAAMSAISSKQLSRSARVFELEGFRRVIPVVLTLHDEMLRFLDSGVPVVPIQQISDFVLNWELFIDSLCVLNDERSEAQSRLA